MSSAEQIENLLQLRKMRFVSLVEGTTLLLLVGVTVPFKHLAGFPLATRLIGSVHGVAFVLYAWMLIQTVSMGGWSRAETAQMVLAAFIPFGAFLNERALARRQSALAASR